MSEKKPFGNKEQKNFKKPYENRNNGGFSKGKDGQKPGFRKDGPKPGYKADGHRTEGFPKDGERPTGYHKEGFRKDDHRRDSFKRDGFRKDGFNRNGNARPAFGDKRPAPKPVMDKPREDLPTTNARKVALEIFRDVVRNDAYAALSLDEQLKNANLTQLDKRFCASIVYRTIENLIRIDYVLSFYLQDESKLDERVKDILRISACQILFHDRIPANAVVDEAVKLTRMLGMEGLTGVTNAVLRNMVREPERVKWPKPEEGAKYLSIMFSVPLWLAEKLVNAYGEQEALKICSYRSDAHYTVIRPNLSRLDDAAFEKLLEKKVWEKEKGLVPHAFRVRMASEIARDADYMGGNFSIQGESSMLSAQVMNVRPGMQVLDCCAAPGGKTAYMAEIMNGTGRVYAWDLHEHRVTLIRAMVKRLRLDNVRPAMRDATQLKEDMVGTMDAVMLDAPCSGLGVMDNKPDIKYRATEASVKDLTEIQEKLLDTCCQYVKRNGTLVYSTCSMLPEENVNQIKAFLERHPEFRVVDLPTSVPENIRKEYGQYGLQLLPHRDQIEGFFIAKMRKVK